MSASRMRSNRLPWDGVALEALGEFLGALEGAVGDEHLCGRRCETRCLAVSSLIFPAPRTGSVLPSSESKTFLASSMAA